MSRAIAESARAFLATRQSLMLATVGENGKPTASIVPFVRTGREFYIYTSRLSQHTRDMLENERQHVSAMVVEDEGSAKNAFARERITFTCAVVLVPNESAEWEFAMGLFESSFGKLFGPIRPLGDFTLFRLGALEAVYVWGFGHAYRLSGDLSDPVHIRGTGPGAKEYIKSKKAGGHKKFARKPRTIRKK